MKLVSKNKGFTLIELLVVIAIIGILASVVLASLNSARLKGNDSRRVAELRQIANALEMYYLDNNAYPIVFADSRTSADWNLLAAYLAPQYISVLPIDPRNGLTEGVMCSNCGEYHYGSTNGRSFILSTYLAVDGGLTTSSNQFGPYYSITSNCLRFDFWSCT